MEAREGTHRRVYMCNNSVVKISKIDPKVERKLKYLYQRGDVNGFKKWLLGHEGDSSFSSEVFGGVLENLREWDLTSKLEGIVVPTRLSIAGIINIQDFAQPSPLGDEEIWQQLIQDVGYDVFHDPHTFSNSANYGVHSGSLKLLDYGSLRANKVLLQRQDQFRTAFNTLTAHLR